MAIWAYSNHPYLIKKGFNENFYLKQDSKGSLLIPLKDENGKIGVANIVGFLPLYYGLR